MPTIAPSPRLMTAYPEAVVRDRQLLAEMRHRKRHRRMR